MQFSLNSDQIIEIFSSYGVTLSLIKKVEAGLNETELVKDEEDYFLLVCEVVSQYMSVFEICKSKITLEEKRANFMSLSEIIVQQLALYYQNFDNDKTENKVKFYNLVKSSKKRHN